MLYRTLRWIARVALRWFYRDIEVRFAERVPDDGAALLVGNHQNALVDAMVIGTALPRVVRLTAKATLLENPISNAIVKALGIIPLRRAHDERAVPMPLPPDQQRNSDAFRAIVDSLGEGGVVLIFPEGISHSGASLAPLRTGAARIALRARRDHGLADLPIVPVGLTFERKWEPRSRIVMEIGKPVTASDIDDSPQGVGALTARIDDALRAVTLNYATRDDADRMYTFSTLLAGVLDDVRALGNPDPPLGRTVDLERRLERYRSALAHTGDAVQTRVSSFVARVDSFRNHLTALKIAPNEVDVSTSALDGARFIVRELAILLVGGPLALWGFLHHWIPLRLARILARRLSRQPDEPAMHTLVAGLVFVIVLYLLLAGTIAWKLGPLIAVAYLMLLPIAGSWDFQFRDRFARAHARARTYLTLRSNAPLRQELQREAAWLRDEARLLDLALQTATP